MFLDQFSRIQKNIPLAPFTHFNIGGPARYFYALENSDEARDIIRVAREQKIPLFILGGGSNILISDKGFDGLVIRLANKKIEIQEDLVSVDAGVLLPQLVMKTVEAGLANLEYLVGIPGTVGGAIRGNAGVPGWEIGDYVVEATVIDADGTMKQVDRNYFQFGYRDSVIKHNRELIVSAVLKLPKGDTETLKQKMREMTESRIKKQPKGRSCGSFFKNPAKDKPAGMLIDQCGLKGFRMGDAMISEMHANFFMNVDHATFDDFMQLAAHVKKTVYDKFGILLEEEVQIVH